MDCIISILADGAILSHEAFAAGLHVGDWIVRLYRSCLDSMVHTSYAESTALKIGRRRTQLKLSLRCTCIVAFACGLCLMGCRTAQISGGSIRCDGIYRAPRTGWNTDTTAGAVPSQTRFASYLRFYPDRTVLDVSSGDDSEKVATWFKRGHREFGEGKYRLKGSDLRFSTKSKWGVVDFTGTVAGEDLKMQWFSHINRQGGQETYRFVKVAFPREE